MPNADNLKGKGFESRSTEEVRKIASRGGKKSGEVRRRKKSMKTSAKMLMELPVTDKLQSKLEALGIDESETNYQTGILVAMLQEALKGNVRAAQLIVDLIGESPKQTLSEKEYKLRKDEFEYKKKLDGISNPEDYSEDALSASLRELAERGLEGD